MLRTTEEAAALVLAELAELGITAERNFGAIEVGGVKVAWVDALDRDAGIWEIRVHGVRARGNGIFAGRSILAARSYLLPVGAKRAAARIAKAVNTPRGFASNV